MSMINVSVEEVYKYFFKMSIHFFIKSILFNIIILIKNIIIFLYTENKKRVS